MPGQVAAEIRNEHLGRAEAERVIEFTNRLKAIDDRLDCFLCPVTIPEEDLYIGFYYIRRRNDDGSTSTWRVQGPNGGFVEPNDRILDRFREYDTWAHADVLKRMRAEAERKRREREWQAQETGREFEEKLTERLKHVLDTQIAVTGAMKDRLKDES